MRRAFIACVVVSSIALLSSAPASHLRVTDPRDTSGVLDVRAVSVSGTRTVRWKVVTWETWSVRAMRDRGFIIVYLDTFGDERGDYYALVRSTGSSLEATLWRDRERRPDVRQSRLHVSRPGPASVQVEIPLSKLNMPQSRLEYAWRVQTLFSSSICSQVCFDRVPDEGSVPEPNPDASPSPSPTTLPTVVPTATSTPPR